MIIKKIDKSDKMKLEKLIHRIESNLESEKWWLPIKETAREHFFDDKWTCFYGAYDNDELVGASALFINEYEYKESLLHIGEISGSIAEIGRCMVAPEYRGKNLLVAINIELIEVARKYKINNILATIHPENLASKKSFKKIGFKHITSIIKDNNYEREIFLITDI